MELKIDNREKIKNLFPKDLNITFENLDIGDYIISKENMSYIIIERKTIPDYWSSIKDGRLREQKKRLLDNYDSNKIFYLVEGNLSNHDLSLKYHNLNNDTIISSIINTMLRDKINVIHTANVDESIIFIKSLYKKIEKYGFEFINNCTNYQDDLFNSNKKKSKISKELCHKLMLSCIPGISIKTSTRILNNFSTVGEFIEKLKTMDLNCQIEYIQNIKGEKENSKKISKTIALNIIEYLLN